MIGKNFFRSRMRRYEEWQEEIESHLALRAERNESAGIPRDAARQSAYRQFGSTLRTLEDIRAIYTSRWFDNTCQDARYTLRSFRKNPLFTFTAITTLAVGIGAATAVFSVVDPLLFRSLPYADAGRLVSFGVTAPIDQSEFLLGKSYVQWRGLLTPFESVATVSSPLNVDLGDSNVVQIRCFPVQANLLATLGASVALGHDFVADDDRPGAPRVALVSYGLWKSHFGENPSILQRAISVDGEQMRVVGILPENFEMPNLEKADILIPQRLDPTEQLRSQTGHFLRAFGRLKPGVAIQRAGEQLQPFFTRFMQGVPEPVRKEIHLRIRPLRDLQFHDVRLASWMLLGAVLALLSIACANVANLLTARGAARRTELAVRAALGAGRARLLQQAMTETAILSAAGAVAGCVFASLLFHLMGTLPPEGILRLKEGTLNARVLAFTLLACIFAAVGSAIPPALQQLRLDFLACSRGVGPPRSFSRHLLIAFQIAISIVLLSGASLLARSLAKLETQDIGLSPSHVITASFTLDHRRYNTPQKLNRFFAQLEAKIQSIPGVSVAALADSAPPSGSTHERPLATMRIAGRPQLPNAGGMVKFRYVDSGYFRALRIPIVAGRGFNKGDLSPTQTSLVLSAALAKRMFGNSDPLGQHVFLNDDLVSAAVVGIAADVKNNGLAAAVMPEYYRLRKDYPDFSLGHAAVALFRTSLAPRLIEPWIRAQIAGVDPHIPVTIETMKQRVEDDNKRPRLLAILVASFSAFGLLLAAIGLYGVVALLVAQRTREIGIRISVGATRVAIVLMILRHAAQWTAAGTMLGLSISLILTKLIRGLLFHVSPYDPLSLLIAILILVTTALAASCWPSLRAARIDPACTLRSN